ncbi:hypothetical protein EJ05DRAFT_252600 [Pseudovirgaria hyperparasitica]|uniref:Pullulan synthetase n=1 Tax=Pseudovirgaria hyperparasitica TaxID=470096 RepID=A0A6A6WGC9_9PEZI|nr:uncharacterized protein EJ05DRAFT_252600 [Pseudovirgaria hyperparasitica]KAF2761100.1 hypothetical protein EJ05DRAFT_252600 [Pseudovirgaria hyperparasitica]
MLAFTFSLSLLSMTSLVYAAPAPPLSPPAFYLVTTAQNAAKSPSSQLAEVSALSLFDPFSQPNYLVRTIEAGYGSLPAFTLTKGRLHTTSLGPHGIGTFVFNSTDIGDDTELQFVADAESTKGRLALYKGYLLTVAGDNGGWTICPGVLGQDVIKWRGTATGCRKTYVHAVRDAPY